MLHIINFTITNPAESTNKLVFYAPSIYFTISNNVEPTNNFISTTITSQSTTILNQPVTLLYMLCGNIQGGHTGIQHCQLLNEFALSGQLGFPQKPSTSHTKPRINTHPKRDLSHTLWMKNHPQFINYLNSQCKIIVG